jgi:hypothetical protein
MKKNMGKTDRMIRLIIAGIMAFLYVSGAVDGTLGYVVIAIGAIMLLTSFVSFCPLYAPFGIKTCKTE